MSLKPLGEILKEGFRVKVDYIRYDLAMELNMKNRGRSNQYPSAMDLFYHIFNGPDNKPIGELQEFKLALVKLKDRSSCLLELADLYYQGVRFEDKVSVPERYRLTDRIFRVGKRLHLEKGEVIDGCIIKYTSRVLRGKMPAHESRALEDHLGGTEPISRGQKRRVLKEVGGIFLLKDYYRKLAEQC